MFIQLIFQFFYLFYFQLLLLLFFLLLYFFCLFFPFFLLLSLLPSPHNILTLVQHIESLTVCVYRYDRFVVLRVFHFHLVVLLLLVVNGSHAGGGLPRFTVYVPDDENTH